ncbi:MAG: tetratricopeptide repeat protein [Sulfitobacter sp.]
MQKLILMLAVTAGPVFSEDCPAPRDNSSELSALFQASRAAPNEQAGRALSAKMWEVWLRAPNEQAQAILDSGMRHRDSFDFVGAFEEFDRLATYCPDYAEGFNQRAYVHYLRENYADALIDLDQVLIISPTHVPAQSGRALTLLKLGRMDEARVQLQAALINNPWLSERFLLAKGGPLAPVGEEI